MTLIARLETELKDAMKERDAERREVGAPGDGGQHQRPPGRRLGGPVLDRFE